MINFKNLVVGFLVSFVGSIPLGYLNVVGYKIYAQQGFLSTIWFLMGVVFIEFFVIYFTLVFANLLAENKKLTKIIEGFAIVFMFVLAYVFYASASKAADDNGFLSFGSWGTFLSGVFLSAINFVQLPFWTGWNLYLLNGNYIQITKSRKYYYILGTLLGTFGGMLTLILSLGYLTSQTDFLEKYLLKAIIPLVFVGLGVFQSLKFYRKYYK